MNNFNLEASSNDEDFFGSLESSRRSLSQLFGVTTTQTDDNSTLKYKAPKQPLEEPSAGAAALTPSAWNVQLAKLVTAYQNSGPVGKLGMALIRNSLEEYKIVLYKAKNNIVATCTLLSASDRLARPVYRQHTYLQFYDDSQSYWSLLFEQRDDEVEFIKALHVTAVKIIELENKTQSPSKQPELSKELASLDTTIPSVDADIKGALFSRLPKVGQKVPHFKVAGTKSDLSDESTDTEVVSNSIAMTNKPAIVPRNTTRMLTQKSQITSTVGVYNSCNLPLQLQETQFMQMMLTESRTQNTELRLNLGKLENKMEKVLDKIDVLTSSSSSITKLRRDDELLEMEEKLLELKKENFKLSKALEESRTLKAQQSINTFLASHENEFQSLDLIATHEWPEVCSELIKKANALQAELKQVRSKNGVLSQRLRDKINKLAEQNNHLQEKQDKLETLTLELDELKASVNTQHNGSVRLQENMHELTQKLAEKQHKQVLDTKTAVREIMNSLYSSIASQLNDLPGNLVSSEQVLSIVGKVIKYETVQAMQLK